MLAYWQLGSAGMLAWGLAAAVPIVIHLLSRRKYRQERWAAMAFLLAALRKNARRMQLEQWLLLAVRSAILLLFALALADPRSSLREGSASEASGPSHVVLVIDGSYSMDYRVGDTSRFEAAKTLARQIVADSAAGSGYSLVLMSRPPRSIFLDAALDRADALREIDNLELQQADAALPATLAEIETVLRRSKAEADATGRFVDRQVYVFSDLQKATWDEATSAACRDQLGRLASLGTIQLVDMGQGGESNLAVARLAVDRPLIVSGREVQIQADIQSYAREDRPNQTIEFQVDGERVGQKRIDCPAGGGVSVSLAHRFAAPGEHLVEAHLTDDCLPLDNRRWLSVPVRAKLRVLCIGGRPGETRHIALALAPEKSAAGDFEVIEAPESRLLEDDLPDFDAVVLANVGRVSRSEAFALHRFVSSGRGLIVFLGDQVQTENYNQHLVDDAELRCLPARLIEEASTAPYTFDPLDYHHPIVGPFRGFPNSGLLTTPTWKYIRAAPLEGAETALAFSSRDAAIVGMRIGRGACLLVTTAGSPEPLVRGAEPATPWTALPIWPSFPPLMHEMVRLALAGQTAGRNLLIGDDMTGGVPSELVESAILVTGPGKFEERLQARDDAGERRWTLSHVEQRGAYEARFGAVTQLYAVNVDASEGNLARIDTELLPNQLRRESSEEATQRVLPAQARARADFRWLLSCVLVLLLAEPLLAWQFGRGRT